MFENFTAALNNLGRFSPDQLRLIYSKTSVRSLKKNETILKEGEVCEHFHFLSQGAARQFKIDKNLNEINSNLYVANDWIINHKSFTSRNPSSTTIIACEISEIISIDMTSVHDLISNSPSFFQLGRILENVNAELDFTLTPEEKYLWILENKPKWLQVFPLKQIASFLAITPETLSRVRKKISN